MRVRGIEQPLFQARELGRDAEDVGLDLLHLLVEAFHLLAVAGIGDLVGAGKHAERSNYRDPELSRCAHTHLCTKPFCESSACFAGHTEEKNLVSSPPGLEQTVGNEDG